MKAQEFSAKLAELRAKYPNDIEAVKQALAEFIRAQNGK